MISNTLQKRLPVRAIVLAAVGLGVAGDLLLQASGPPGLNVTLLFAGLAAAVVFVGYRAGRRLGAEARAFLAVGVLFGGALLWRGSELLRFLAFVAAATAFAVPAYRAGRAWVRRARPFELLEAVAGAGLHAVLGVVRVLVGRRPEPAGSGDAPGTARVAARSALVGSLLAVVPLVVFGALFFSADPVFARIVGDAVRIDLAELASHLVVAALLSWLAAGYLVGFASGTRLDAVRDLGGGRPSLRAADVAVATGLVNLLFLVFVLVQFRYLFGGAGWVEVTPGLTYADYAREGFFQLVVATALGLPWLLAADALGGEREGRARGIFRALAGAQLLLLLAIVASAVQRMQVYLDAYGLTEQRFVAMAVLGWLALLVVGFGATVLRGRRTRFAFGALVSGFVLVAALQVANPTAIAARSHLDRARAPASGGSDATSRVDVSYLASLGSDAVPVLVAGLDELGAAGRCEVARSLLARWGSDRGWDWRSWNHADGRARRVVEAHAARLRRLAETATDGAPCG